MINVYDLYCLRKTDNKRNQKTFDMILNKCSTIIKKANNLGENITIIDNEQFYNQLYNQEILEDYVLKKILSYFILMKPLKKFHGYFQVKVKVIKILKMVMILQMVFNKHGKN